MTTLNESRKAINDRFLAAWGATTPVVLDNEIDEHDTDVNYVRLYVRNLISGQETLGRKGNRKFERNGLILCQVLTPVNIGTLTADNLAKQAQDIFEGETFDGVTVDDATTREIGPDEDNSRYQINVEANFRYYETK